MMQKILMKYLFFLPNRFRFAGTAIFQKSLLAENGLYQKKNYPNGWSKINRVVQKLQFMNKFRLKPAKCHAFCESCETTNRVVEQVQ
jgi:hypothetical protein